MKRFIGGWMQCVVWYLCNPHDTWLIEYRIDGERYGGIRQTNYRMARRCAKELRGKIIGHRVGVIAA